MKTRSLAFTSTAFTFFCVASFAACSSSSDTASGSDSGAENDATKSGDTGGPINDPQNCVAPGTAGNELGIGGYCSPLGGQCDKAGPGGAARICTADLTSTPAHAWFCTYPCSTDTDCGTNNKCVHKAEGSGCIPTACAFLDDGGDSVDDASSSDAADGADH